MVTDLAFYRVSRDRGLPFVDLSKGREGESKDALRIKPCRKKVSPKSGRRFHKKKLRFDLATLVPLSDTITPLVDNPQCGHMSWHARRRGRL